MSEKQTILEIENVRVRKWDDQNYFIERKETYTNPKDKKEITGYRFKGFYSTLSECLKAIHVKGLLINENNCAELTDVLNQIKESERRIIEAVRSESNE